MVKINERKSIFNINVPFNVNVYNKVNCILFNEHKLERTCNILFIIVSLCGIPPVTPNGTRVKHIYSI